MEIHPQLGRYFGDKKFFFSLHSELTLRQEGTTAAENSSKIHGSVTTEHWWQRVSVVLNSLKIKGLQRGQCA